MLNGEIIEIVQLDEPWLGGPFGTGPSGLFLFWLDGQLWKCLGKIYDLNQKKKTSEIRNEFV